MSAQGSGCSFVDPGGEGPRHSHHDDVSGVDDHGFAHRRVVGGEVSPGAPPDSRSGTVRSGMSSADGARCGPPSPVAAGRRAG
ncbi:hypothetical protein NKH77_18890 [Streptomyces sp. M19]